MNRESLTKLRLDRRLMHRKGWIAPAELEGALRDLPDAAAKATTLGEVEDQNESRESAADAAPEAPAS